jgi:hypothetical protein
MNILETSFSASLTHDRLHAISDALSPLAAAGA